MIVANTMKGQRGKGGSGIGPEETLVAGALTGTTAQLDDADTHRLVATGTPMSQRIHETDGPAPTLTSSKSPGRGGSEGPLIAAPLTKGSATGEGVNAPGRRQEDDVNIVAYGFMAGQGAKAGSIAIEEEMSPTLKAAESGTNMVPTISFGPDESDPAVSFAQNQRGELREAEYAMQLTGGGGKPGEGYSAVRVGAGVRRLTPTECERLQGLPDGWTSLNAKTPDSRRYSALGDAVTANVAEWIGERLTVADEEPS